MCACVKEALHVKAQRGGPQALRERVCVCGGGVRFETRALLRPRRGMLAQVRVVAVASGRAAQGGGSGSGSASALLVDPPQLVSAFRSVEGLGF